MWLLSIVPEEIGVSRDLSRYVASSLLFLTQLTISHIPALNILCTSVEYEYCITGTESVTMGFATIY